MTIFNDANSKELKDFEKNISTYMGIFYVMEYGDYVKIGYSHMPYERLTALKRQAVKYSDLRTGKIALSIPHTNYRENEKQLHVMFKKYRKQDTELFKIDFKDCIKLIENSSIKYKDESKEMEEESDQFLEEFKRFMFYGINEIQIKNSVVEPVSLTQNIDPNIDDSLILELQKLIGIFDEQNQKLTLNTQLLELWYDFITLILQKNLRERIVGFDPTIELDEFSSVQNLSSMDEIYQWIEQFSPTDDYYMLLEIITEKSEEGVETVKKEILEYGKEKRETFYNGKAICIDPHDKTDCFTKNKEYLFIDGKTRANGNKLYPIFNSIESFEDLQKHTGAEWLEVQTLPSF